MEQITFSTVL